ncbi:MAG: Asp23/Gls24 family envelope stress response protein [Candidatus Omnitrophica bacterium CG11_big_fil_rev_8_21_14_0_20_42_13]|uniref:Asp23/Gls24 family envelope stress response protein n=1 Tax=Candidatus Ghiorseimicrobium undicola TaxID=1974746 RepID=A0A2H0LZZ5_9BACT|nr:MAG: Asp23/Gls24 family envelope stress response protein [Candidatus Omnitrophica bacterium CG11_big_fil_rev_8_21_14_0_20_42_13]
MNEGTATDLGKIRIHKKVIASIASIATQDIEGVAKIGGDLKSGIYDLVFKKNATKGITVEFDKNDEVSINIPVVIKYGFNLPEVASKIQESIRSSIEKMTDVAIKDINIDVQSVEKGGS